MKDSKSKELVDKVFKEIENAKSIQELDEIIGERLESKRMDAVTYPQLEYSISGKEIEHLRNRGLINEDGNLNHDCEKLNEEGALVKLLYAILWKQGDLKKVKHIVAGIEGKDEKRSSGFVFHQFGRHLESEHEPIVDQHVLRAFVIWKCPDKDRIGHLRKKSLINAGDIDLIDEYKNWLKSFSLTEELKNTKNYVYHIDQVLFALGRMVKKK